MITYNICVPNTGLRARYNFFSLYIISLYDYQHYINGRKLNQNQIFWVYNIILVNIIIYYIQYDMITHGVGDRLPEVHHSRA